MKVASYNIHKCRGLDGVTRPDRIIGVIWRARRRRHRPSGGRSPLWPPRRASRSGRHRARDRNAASGAIGRIRIATAGTATPSSCAENPISYSRSRLKLPGGRASRSDRRRTGSRRRGVSRYCGASRVASSFTAGSGQRADDRLPGSAAACRPFCLAISTSGADAGGLRSRGLEPMFGVAPPILSFPSRRPIFALDRILGWPDGLHRGSRGS